MLDYTLIGERIRYYRKKRGYTQEKLAETICTSAAYISNIERAVKKPSLQKLAQIAGVFEIPVDDLIASDDYDTGMLQSLPAILDQCTSREKRQILKSLSEIMHIIELKS